ncbi:ProQ activator of osmoprotectant transporter prop [Burkholderia sp. Bp8963]|uniref:ProQ/FinO family protein n=1 Tax=Burkholderia sp. Bp8963 TaxID=2184547 RepID=UPI000F58FCE4|nr:ProQ/FinO family protein [Burkholderia sp. Bp8963]RQS65670.1 ProQ activator of osmoprotectant transporter prop [Burkholderia sp. Bp8963]
MGFEQLAELRNQLAAKAKQERNAKRSQSEAKPSSGGNASSGARPSAGAKGPSVAKASAGAKGSSGAKASAGVKGSSAAKASAGAKGASGARASTPVDPVVVAIGKLQRRFPLAFPKNPAPKVPLKVGIWADLANEAQAAGLSEAELRDAMATWCRGNRYWSCLVEDAVRVDLQGNEAGRVSKDDAARARRLKARRPGKGAAQSAKADAKPVQDESQQATAEPQADHADVQAAPAEPQAAKAE